jgi:hypothetical protein
MTIRVKKGSSRLVHAELQNIDGIEFFSRPELPELTESSTDKQHTVADVERLDSISRRYYRQDSFYWVIAHRNDIRIFPEGLMPGQRIIIPSAAKIRKELF